MTEFCVCERHQVTTAGFRTRRPAYTLNSCCCAGSMLPETHLDGQCCQDALCVDQAVIAQVVQATILEDLGTGLEPHSLTKWHTVLGQQLRRDATQGTCSEVMQRQNAGLSYSALNLE
eukprot:GHUV01050510.1.p1 GENE.GHUV01050510.1~~GHUV01050510.1.p1  ORF type:complete len:118 (+),score=18.03 GHUV01050510.1:460-813(+)